MKTVHMVIGEDNILQADIQKTILQSSVKRSFFKTLSLHFAETNGQGDSVMKGTSHSLLTNRFFSSPTNNFHSTVSVSCSTLQMNNVLKISYSSKYVAL